MPPASANIFAYWDIHGNMCRYRNQPIAVDIDLASAPPTAVAGENVGKFVTKSVAVSLCPKSVWQNLHKIEF